MKEPAVTTKEPAPVSETEKPAAVSETEKSDEVLVQQMENMTVEAPTAEQLEEEDSDDGEWITPENIEEFKATELGVTPEELKKPKNLAVACMTGDFAMQVKKNDLRI